MKGVWGFRGKKSVLFCGWDGLAVVKPLKNHAEDTPHPLRVLSYIKDCEQNDR